MSVPRTHMRTIWDYIWRATPSPDTVEIMNQQQHIRVIIADDQELVRVGFAMVIIGATLTAHEATGSAAVAVVVWVSTVLAAVALILLIENGDDL